MSYVNLITPIPPENTTDTDIILAAKKILARQFQKGAIISSAKNCIDHLILKLAHYEREVFWIIFLDTAHQIIAEEVIAQGTINSAAVYPREVVKKALKHNASAVIFAHNHLSGTLEASQNDKNLTRLLSDILHFIDIKVLDHIIIAGINSFSFAEAGLLEY